MGSPVTASGAWVIDLDGVLWLAGHEIPGSGDAVDKLRRHGTPLLFATNNADPTLSDLAARLDRIGIRSGPHELVTSAEAAAAMVEPDARVLACGGPGLVEALTARGATVVETGPADAVVVGMTRDFDYGLLTRAELAVRGGARLIGTNEDPTHPTPEGLLPGSGALVAAVATAAQQDAVWAGKPHRPMMELIRSRAPRIDRVVGDRPATDGRLARALGVRYSLVLSGVTGIGHGPLEVEPDDEVDDLATLVAQAGIGN